MKTLGLLALLLLPLSLQAQELTAEAYRIYRAFLEQDRSRAEVSDTLRFFVKDSTVAYQGRRLRLNAEEIRFRLRWYDERKQIAPDSTAWYELAERFSSQPFQAVPFDTVRLNQGRIEARTWTRALDDYYFGGTRHGRAKLGEDFPQSARISGFSQIRTDGTRALFYFEIVSDYKEGEGVWVLMRREPEGWKLVLTMLIWVS
jgi:hypothetical protein